jgi:hypothetical protein
MMMMLVPRRLAGGRRVVAVASTRGFAAASDGLVKTALNQWHKGKPTSIMHI